MADYISRDYALHNIERGLLDTETDRNRAIHYVRELTPAADVVARDCYDRILAENDTMREQLAQIGKKPGDRMDDVRPVVRGEWIRGNESRTSPTKDSYICSVCGEKTLSGFCGNPAKTNFCPNCGAEMSDSQTLEDAAQDADAGAMAPVT